MIAIMMFWAEFIDDAGCWSFYGAEEKSVFGHVSLFSVPVQLDRALISAASGPREGGTKGEASRTFFQDGGAAERGGTAGRTEGREGTTRFS